MGIVELSAKGYLLIPEPLCEKYGIKPGAKLVFSETKDGLLLTPLKEYISSMRGIFSGSGPDFEERMRWKQEDLEKE